MNIVRRFAKTGLVIATFSVLAIAPAATAQSSSTLSTADQHFVKEAAQGGMAEVQLGQLAVQKASSDSVKQFGQRMINDHSKANDQLKQLAASKDVSIPQELSAKDQEIKDNLSKLSGEQFDKAYMSDMVKDHKKDVATFQHESTAAQNMQVKQFAKDTLPTLKSHLNEAEKINTQEMAKQ